MHVACYKILYVSKLVYTLVSKNTQSYFSKILKVVLHFFCGKHFIIDI